MILVTKLLIETIVSALQSARLYWFQYRHSHRQATMRQKMVIKVNALTWKRSKRSQALEQAAKMEGVIYMGIAGDEKDRLEVVGEGVDIAGLVGRLKKKVGDAHILQVEEIKDKEMEGEEEKPAENGKEPAEGKELTAQPQWYWHPSSSFYSYPPPPCMVVYDEPRPDSCTIM